MKSISNSKFYIFLILSFSVVIILGPSISPSVDWRQSFSAIDKIPYGNYILYRGLPFVFPNQTIQPVQQNIYETLRDTTYMHTNYVFINHTLNLDRLETDLLLDFVSDGNQVFMAAQQFGTPLSDTLGIRIGLGDNPQVIWEDTLTLSFANTSLSNSVSNTPTKYEYHTGALPLHFESYDTTKTRSIGIDNHENVNFIKIPFGAGMFYLNSTPLAFTNYYMLKDNNDDYITTALSHLPNQATLWDEYYKIGRIETTTSIRYILSRPPLRMAYYLTLLTVGLFIIIEGRRKRAYIPVITPLTNQTLDFVTTIGRLFFQQKNHKRIAEKRITYFYEVLRTQWHIDVHHPDDELYEEIALKSGVSQIEVTELFSSIHHIRSSDIVKTSDLIKLNTILDKFSYGRINE